MYRLKEDLDKVPDSAATRAPYRQLLLHLLAPRPPNRVVVVAVGGEYNLQGSFLNQDRSRC